MIVYKLYMFTKTTFNACGKSLCTYPIVYENFLTRKPYVSQHIVYSIVTLEEYLIFSGEYFFQQNQSKVYEKELKIS